MDDDQSDLAAEQSSLPAPTGVKYAFAVINDDGNIVIGIKPNGGVYIGEGFTADDASRAFWRFLETVRVNGEKVMEP